MKACSFAKNEWIVLIDSDNFAHKDYFVLAKKYIENLMGNADVNLQHIILASSKARHQFDFSHLFIKMGFLKNNHLEHQTNPL